MDINVEMEELYEELVVSEVVTKTKRAFEIGRLSSDRIAELTPEKIAEFKTYMFKVKKMPFLTASNAFKRKELDYLATKARLEAKREAMPEEKRPLTPEEMIAQFEKNKSVTKLDSEPEEEEEKSISVGLDSKYGGLRFISSTNKYIIDFEFLDKEETVSKGAKGVFNTTYNVYKTNIKTDEESEPVVTREANIDANFSAGKYKPYNEENLARAKELLSKPTRATKK